MRIIGAIKRQFFHMVTHVFDNSNLSQGMFAIDTWRAVIFSLGHGRKHMLTILPTVWRPGLMLWLNYNAVLHQTIICFCLNEAKRLCLNHCPRLLNDVECEAFNLFVM